MSLRCLRRDCAWTRKATARTTSPNVLRMIDIFNRLSKWCTTEVLASDDERERAQLVCFFLLVSFGVLFPWLGVR